ncbi:MAG: DUF554 family protein [Bacilli bacterium]
MLATVVNGAAIACGGLIGALLGGRIKKDICAAVLKVVGFAVFLLGLIGVANSAFYFDRFDLLLIAQSGRRRRVASRDHRDGELGVLPRPL